MTVSPTVRYRVCIDTHARGAAASASAGGERVAVVEHPGGGDTERHDALNVLLELAQPLAGGDNAGLPQPIVDDGHSTGAAHEAERLFQEGAAAARAAEAAAVADALGRELAALRQVSHGLQLQSPWRIITAAVS